MRCIYYGSHLQLQLQLTLHIHIKCWRSELHSRDTALIRNHKSTLFVCALKSLNI